MEPKPLVSAAQYVRMSTEEYSIANHEAAIRTYAMSHGYAVVMVSPDGRRRLVLKDGERKAIHTDRTILVPGPKKEVACIRAIFGLADG